MRRTNSCSSGILLSESESAPSAKVRSDSSPVTTSSTSQRKKSTETVRLLVLGAKGVGKSALTVRLLTGRFIGDYCSNQDYLHKRPHTVTKLADSRNENAARLNSVNLEVLDTTSQTTKAVSGGADTTLSSSRTCWSMALIIVYDITSQTSFRLCEETLRLIREQGIRQPCLVLGNKTDAEHLRQVPYSELERLIDGDHCCLGAEVSAAKDYANVTNVFNKFIEEYRYDMLCLAAGSVKSTGIKRRKSFVNVAKSLTHLIRNARSTGSFRKSA